MAMLMTRSKQQDFHVHDAAKQFFRVLTTCSDVRSTYHLEFRFGYFASVAWSCDYVAIDSVCDGDVMATAMVLAWMTAVES